MKKMLSNDGWSLKNCSCERPAIEPPVTPGKEVSALEDDHESVSSAESEGGRDDHFRFLGETCHICESLVERSVCKCCKKGESEVTFGTCCLAANVHTKQVQPLFH